ncbi:MAG: winged helix-turn-helix transcriptional regulator [Staphylothermus sp.]|nr:winged helix-turn-helix transcriptional regulator [Staphylothermus sp.]
MIPESEVENISRILSVFSEQSRLKILLLLYYNGPLPVCIIAKALRMDQTLVSHHLKTLKEASLVEYEKVSKYRLYRLTDYAAKIIDKVLKAIMG